MRSITVVILVVCLAAVVPSRVAAASLEVSGTLGFLSDNPGDQRDDSSGWLGNIMFGQAGPFVMGLGVGVNQFDNTGDAGGVTFRILSFDMRVPVVDANRFGLFIVMAPELAVSQTSFSKEARASNELIPANLSDTSLGLSLGTGFTVDLFGEWLSVVSTQKFHLIMTEVEGSALFVVSLGLAFSN